MSRNIEYQFVSADERDLESELISAYEAITGITVRPASPERLFIQWITSIILLERVQTNYAGNQNIPSRAEGANLDALGELLYNTERPEAKFAVCTERFYISEPQNSAILVPAGTRVTDNSRVLFWETVEDSYVNIGDSYVDVRVQCQEAGTFGNGYTEGQINVLVDVFDYYSKCENVTASDGGTDQADDDEYFELMRTSMDGYSTAGGAGNYIYHAMKVSSEIADVVANSPSPGEVRLYVIMADGKPASEEMKKAVLESCNADNVRPMTDHVQVVDPELVSYDIDFTYWISSNQTGNSSEIQSLVDEAVQEYIMWQGGKLGRDINPSQLIGLLMMTGIKRVELRSPVFTRLRDGQTPLGDEYQPTDTIPQMASFKSSSVINGGVEDE